MSACWADVTVKNYVMFPTDAEPEYYTRQCCAAAVYLGLCKRCYVSIFGKEPPTKERQSSAV